MSKTRDLSEKQFRKAAMESGFTPDALGYWKLAKPHDHISVYRFNGGTRRRSQLAYLCACQKREEERCEP